MTPTGPLNPDDLDMIKMLETALKLARSGKLHQLFLVCDTDDGGIGISSMLCNEADHRARIYHEMLKVMEQDRLKDAQQVQPPPHRSH